MDIIKGGGGIVLRCIDFFNILFYIKHIKFCKSDACFRGNEYRGNLPRYDNWRISLQKIQ